MTRWPQIGRWLSHRVASGVTLLLLVGIIVGGAFWADDREDQRSTRSSTETIRIVCHETNARFGRIAEFLNEELRDEIGPAEIEEFEELVTFLRLDCP